LWARNGKRRSRDQKKEREERSKREEEKRESDIGSVREKNCKPLKDQRQRGNKTGLLPRFRRSRGKQNRVAPRGGTCLRQTGAGNYTPITRKVSVGRKPRTELTGRRLPLQEFPVNGVSKQKITSTWRGRGRSGMKKNINGGKIGSGFPCVKNRVQGEISPDNSGGVSGDEIKQRWKKDKHWKKTAFTR